MKRLAYLIIPVLSLVLAGFSGCEKSNMAVNDEQETWVWSMENLTVTLNLYPNENKYYTTVVGSIPENSGVRSILFSNNTWVYYKMAGDTMYIRRENENFPTSNDRYNKWLIHQYSEQHLEMEYAGTLPAIPIITNYLFNFQN
jgi:hypothetical protein